MKITRLQASNVLRLVAIDIAPEGHLITVGGANGSGKTSTMNSIAMALGGADLCPSEPIRNGESEAEIRVDFDTDLVVTRKFKREKIVTAVAVGSTSDLQGRMTAETWGETSSTLIVTNKAGAKYPSPQALLDRLYGALAFDPLAFKDDKDQAKTLRALVKLDTTKFEQARADAAAQRAMLKKTLSIKQAQLLALPKHDDAPAAETPLTTEKLVEAERLRKLAEEAEYAVVRLSDQHNAAMRQVDAYQEQILELEAKVKELSGKRRNVEEMTSAALRAFDAAKITAEAARAVVPNVEAISKEMAAAEAMNAKVRANQKFADAETEIKTIDSQLSGLEHAVKDIDAAKEVALRAVQFPVEGLGLSDDGVTFNNLPLAQASSAEQLRVSAAIGFALNPTLKVVLIKNGNLLDDDSLAALAKQAADAEAQVWIEWVTRNKDDVQVFIEDGKVTP